MPCNLWPPELHFFVNRSEEPSHLWMTLHNRHLTMQLDFFTESKYLFFIELARYLFETFTWSPWQNLDFHIFFFSIELVQNRLESRIISLNFKHLSNFVIFCFTHLLLLYNYASFTSLRSLHLFIFLNIICKPVSFNIIFCFRVHKPIAVGP